VTEAPRFSRLDLWGRFERRCVDIVTAALLDLAAESGLPVNEDLLNRRLYFCMRQEVLRRARVRGIPEELPTYEGRNPPSPTDPERATREFKRPDFYWELVDPYESDDDAATKTFVVECKRLTPLRDKRWVHTTQYVASGVLRFIEVAHGYGMHAPSGVMVGYLQGLETDDALREVNVAAAGHNVPPIVRDGEAEHPAVLAHVLPRAFPVDPYRLGHLWIAVRSE
jgi:hypothetical protein